MAYHLKSAPPTDNHREEDVTRTMYKEILGEDNEAKKRGKLEDVPKPTLREKLSKTNDICHAFLDVLPKRSSKYFQNIITAHLCKIPPDFDAGLTEISKMQGMRSYSAMNR